MNVTTNTTPKAKQKKHSTKGLTMVKEIELIRKKLIERAIERLGNKYEKVAYAFSAEVVFNDKLRTSAGRAIYRQNLIELNKDLLSKNRDHLEQTVAHEFAHLISPLLFGDRVGRGHGRGWRYTMAMLGYPADRCHSLDVAREKRRPQKIRATATCGCEGKKHEIKTRMFNRIMNGAKYRCTRCYKPLELEG